LVGKVPKNGVKKDLERKGTKLSLLPGQSTSRAREEIKIRRQGSLKKSLFFGMRWG